MDQKHFILIDATLESLATLFDRPIFEPWLRTFNNVEEAKKFIDNITLPYSIMTYIARDNIFDDGAVSLQNGIMCPLIQTLSELRTVKHITVFCPTLTNDPEPQIRLIASDPRSIRDVIDNCNLIAYVCRDGMNYLNEKIAYYTNGNREIHLAENCQRNYDELDKYLQKIIDRQRERVDAMADAYSNKPSHEAS